MVEECSAGLAKDQFSCMSADQTLLVHQVRSTRFFDDTLTFITFNFKLHVIVFRVYLCSGGYDSKAFKGKEGSLFPDCGGGMCTVQRQYIHACS